MTHMNTIHLSASETHDRIDYLLSCNKEEATRLASGDEVPGASKDFMITACLEQLEWLEEEKPMDYPEFDYQGACELLGLSDYERLNNNETIPRKDELDALYDDMPARYRKSPNWKGTTKLVRCQLVMEKIMGKIENCNEGKVRHQKTKGALDSWVKRFNKWKNGPDYTSYPNKNAAWNKFKKGLDYLKAENKRARDSAHNTSDLWKMWKELLAKSQDIAAHDSSVWATYFNYIPSYGKDKKFRELCEFLIPGFEDKVSAAHRSEVRKKRIGWMEEFISNHEWYATREDSVNEYWVSGEVKEEVDSYAAHSASLNKGEDLRDCYLENKWKEDSRANDNFDIPVLTGGYVPPCYSNPSWLVSYNAFNNGVRSINRWEEMPVASSSCCAGIYDVVEEGKEILASL